MKVQAIVLMTCLTAAGIALGGTPNDPATAKAKPGKSAMKPVMKKTPAKGGNPIVEVNRVVMNGWKSDFTADAKRLLVPVWPWDVRVFELPSGKPLMNVHTGEKAVFGPDNPLNDAAFGPDGEVVTAHRDQMIRVRDKTGKKVLEFQPRPLGQEFQSVRVSKPGRWVIAKGLTQVRVWDLGTGEELARYEMRATWLDIHKDGQRVVTVDQDHFVRVWNGRTGAFRSEFIDHSKKIDRVKFAPDGSLLCWAANQPTFYAVNPLDGEILATFEGHTGNVNDVTSFPDNRLVVSGGVDRTVRVWKKSTGVQVFVKPFAADVQSVGVSPDGKFLTILIHNEVFLYRVL